MNILPEPTKSERARGTLAECLQPSLFRYWLKEQESIPRCSPATALWGYTIQQFHTPEHTAVIDFIFYTGWSELPAMYALAAFAKTATGSITPNQWVISVDFVLYPLPLWCQIFIGSYPDKNLNMHVCTTVQLLERLDRCIREQEDESACDSPRTLVD